MSKINVIIKRAPKQDWTSIRVPKPMLAKARETINGRSMPYYLLFEALIDNCPEIVEDIVQGYEDAYVNCL